MTKDMGYFRYLRGNITSKIFSIRVLVICLVQFLFHDSVVRSINTLSLQYDEDVSPFLFPLMCGSLVFIMIFGFCVLYLFSEVPYMNQKELYYIIRSGRFKWLFAQEITITVLAFFLIVYSFLIDIIRLFPHLSFADTWDRIEMSLAYGTLSADEVLFEMDILQMYSPFEIMLYGSVVGFLVVNFVGHLMYTLSLVFHRLVAVLVGSILALMPIVTFNTSYIFRFVYYVSPFSWISPGYIVRSVSVPNLVYKIAACLAGAIICICVDCIVIKNRDFDWTVEE